MNKIYLLALATTFFISGCGHNKISNELPEEKYTYFGAVLAGIQRCFEGEKMSTELFADTKRAVSYSVSTWAYDQEKLNTRTNEIYSAIDSVEECRRVEAEALIVVANTAEHKQQKQAYQQRQAKQQAQANQQAQSNQNNNTVNCTKIGDFLDTEIKTFSGLVCPVGWLKKY